MFRRSCVKLTALVFVGMLTACTSTVEKWDPDDYTVKSGDTIYTIAWRYELDPEEFADWNDLGPSKIIKPGQRLHTRKPKNHVSSAGRDNDYAEKTAYASPSTSRNKLPVTGAARPDWVKVEKSDTLYSISRRYGVSIDQLLKLNQLKKSSIIQPGQRIYLKPVSVSSETVTEKSKRDRVSQASQPAPAQSPTTATIKYVWPKNVHWQRPSTGRIVKKFNRGRNDAKGIDIAGKLGDNIVASADGKVVYSGDGLISYGKLIILKHNDTYLSAYAYNHKLLVKEGDTVKAGQQIAEMGRKDELSPRLHFEIRKNGKPVDPLKYLPW